MKMTPIPGSIKSALKLIIGIAIIFLLSLRFNPTDILNAITGVQAPLLIVALFVYAWTLFFLSLRWRYILKKMGYTIPVTVAYQGFIAGILISDLTPARVGEVSRPLTIRDMVPIPAGLGSVFLDRYCDFIAIFILGCGGVLLLSAARSPELLLVIILILSVPIVILSAFWFRRNLALNLLHRLNIVWITEFADHLGAAMDSLKNPGRTMGSAIILTLFIWTLQSLRIVLIAAAAGCFLPIQELILIQPLISALALIPVSVSGLGFVEGGYVTLFTQYGIPAATGMAIALLDRVMTVLFHLVVGMRYALRAVGK